MIVLLFGVLISQGHAARLLERYFDLRRPACGSFLEATRLKLPRLKVHTARLTFRGARETDRSAARVLLNDPEIKRWYLADPDTDSRDIERYFEKLRDGVRVHYSSRLEWVRAMRFVIVERGRVRPIGAALIQRAESAGRWEIGYALAPAFRGRGYGIEMVDGLCAVIARIDDGATIEAYPSSHNVRSRVLLSVAGFESRGEEPAEGAPPRNLLYTRSALSRGLSPEESRPSAESRPL